MNTELLKSKLLEAAFNGSLTHADMSTWDFLKIGDFAFTTSGGTPQAKNKAYYEGGTIRWIRSGELGVKYIYDSEIKITQEAVENSSAKSYPIDSVLIALYGATVGKVSILKAESTSNQAICAIFPNERYVPEYMYYFLHSQRENFLEIASGGAQSNISQIKVKNCIIPLPPLAEQKRIVSILEEGFAYIDSVAKAKRNLAETAELLKQKVLQSAFEGSLTHADTSTWDWLPMKEITTCMCDGDWIEKKDQSEEGIRLVQTGNIGNGYFVDKPNSYKYISENTFKRLSCTEIYSGDILISRLPSPVGRSCEIPLMDYRMITAVDCTIVRLKDVILKKYFLFYTQSPIYYYKMAEYNFITGTTRERISRRNLEKMPIPLPPLDEQQRIVTKIEELFAQIDNLTK